MPKVKISEYSATAASNTDINGIDIAEGCAPSGINDAIRTLMKQIKDLQAGTSGDTIPVAAGGTGAATESAARTALGLAIGTNVQAFDSNLTTFVNTFTLPTADGTANQVLATNGSGTLAFAAAATGDVTTTGTQTLTNKTLENPTINNGYTEEVATANTSTAYTIDLANGSVQILTLTGTATITFPANTAGKSFLLLLKQDATGSRAVTWDTDVKWAASTAPTITSTASKADIYSFVCDGTYWYGTTVAQNYL
jgi:hypothetical protein